MKPFSPHTNFFSSLTQVEKRLELEDPSKSPNPLSPPQQAPLPPESNYTSTESSLSSPIYLNLHQTHNSSSTFQDSEPPQAFLSPSPQLSPTNQEDPSQISGPDSPKTITAVDDIQRLIQLLGLSDCKEVDQEGEQAIGLGLKSGLGRNSCYCDGGFYKKIVGVKGPKCVKEVERLDGWIKHFQNGGGEEKKTEPLRLAHLLLGKAAFAFGNSGDGDFGGLEFPSTIEEFLENDPSKD